MMDYKFQSISLEEALALCLETTKGVFWPQIEKITLDKALGRITAKDYHASYLQPPFHRSAVDGYAVRSDDIMTASKQNPIQLTVIGEVNAGEVPTSRVEEKTAIRIMTGAPIPDGANGVLRQEVTDYGEVVVKVYQGLKESENICLAGEDYRAGECLVGQGEKLTFIEIGLLASMGYAEVEVYKQPRIGLFTTGDELIEPGLPLTKGKIYNANQALLYARFQELGIVPVMVKQLPDTASEVAAFLQEAARKVDIIVTTGGVSVGKRDIMHEVLIRAKAQAIFWKVRMKPGAPTIFAMLGKVPILALSGNPFGALANMELLVRPTLYQMSGAKAKVGNCKTAIMRDTFTKSSSCKRFIRGIYLEGEVSLPTGLQSSGVLRTLQGCNCLIEIDENISEIKAGELVKVVLL